MEDKIKLNINNNNLVSKLIEKIIELDKKIIILVKEKSIVGQKGQKGDKGDRGDRGDRGIQGRSIVGPKGLKGDSIKGDRGPRGYQGIPGIGIEGRPGKDGSPDKPQEIANKINTLSQAINIDTIKGLDNIIKNLSSSIRAKNMVGGGGMGNWMHEVFDTSSVTTSVTLTNNIAASGSAIMVRYQGQMLAHNVQYTVSGSTITFTFTLEDNTNIEITYVRA